MTALITHLEELAHNAWPTATTQMVDGWLCRYAGSTSRRLNSVLPLLTYGQQSLPERVGAVEQFYHSRQRPPRFQISPAVQPPELDTFLEQRGYSFKGTVLVQTASITEVQHATTPPPAGTLTIANQYSPAWFETYLAAEAGRKKTAADRQAIFMRIVPVTAYVTWEVEGTAAAIGLGVLERGWVGAFCMSTLPEYRRRGAAAAILKTLADWGAGQGAQNMYLQVFEGNAAALSVYARAGFHTLYPCHFREKP